MGGKWEMGNGGWGRTENGREGKKGGGDVGLGLGAKEEE